MKKAGSNVQSITPFKMLEAQCNPLKCPFSDLGVKCEVVQYCSGISRIVQELCQENSRVLKGLLKFTLA